MIRHIEIFIEWKISARDKIILYFLKFLRKLKFCQIMF